MQTASYYRLEGPYLRMEGQRCSSCSHIQFPPKTVCGSCRSSKLTIHEVARTGKVLTFSEVSSPPAGFSSPLIAALVTLDDGITVTCQLTDVDFSQVHIGMPVEMVTRLISETGPEGCLVYGYKFRPVMA
jgi:uncharacterized OB-fold protein